MRVIPRVLVAAMALMMCTATAAVADRGHDDRISVLPAHRVGGSSGGELLGDRFSQLLAIPASKNPLEGNDNLCLGLGHRYKVASPAGGKALKDDPTTIEMTCTVAVGQSILFVGPSGECSTAEDGEFQAFGERAQQKCALKAISSFPIKSLVLTVDDAQRVDIYNSRFLAISPQGRTVFNAEDPVFGGKPGRATFAAAAWIAEIRGMGRGDHVARLETTVNGEDGETFVLTFVVHFNVVGGR